MIGPVIILVESQIPQNIGKTARAMLNCDLRELRLVRPFVDPCHREARALAAGADEVLEQAKIYKTTAEAIADLHRVFSTSARHRGMVELQLTPKKAASHFIEMIQANHRIGVLFGPERAGLDNEDVALCEGNIYVPVNPNFSSLNLAQAVLLIAYEWYQAKTQYPEMILKTGETVLATREELLGFLNHLETELDHSGYFRADHKKPKMLRTIHNMFSRMPLTTQEVRTLRGIVSDLTDPYGERARMTKRRQLKLEDKSKKEEK